MREKGIFRVVVALLLLPLLLGVATADAKKKKKRPKSSPVTVVSATKSTSADGELATVVATCPAGKIAVGGGFTSAAAGFRHHAHRPLHRLRVPADRRH